MENFQRSRWRSKKQNKLKVIIYKSNIYILSLLIFYILSCNNIIYKKKYITFITDCDKKLIDIYSNDSLIYEGNIKINASVGRTYFEIRNSNPLIKIIINKRIVLLKKISKYKEELIISDYDSTLNILNYKIVKSNFKPGDSGYD